MRNVVLELLRKSAVYGMGSSLNGLVSFVLLPFIIHHLYPFEYGRYALAEMVLNFLLIVLALGMNVAILARYPKLKDSERRPFLSSVFGFVLLGIAGLELIFLIVVLPLGSLMFRDLTAEAYLLVAMISAAETVWMLFTTIYRAQGAAWRYVILSGIQSSFTLVFQYAFIARYGFRDEGLLYGRLLADGLLLVMLIPDYLRFPPTINVRAGVELCKIGLPMIPSTLAATWVAMSPRFFIERLGTTADVGAFAIDAKLAAAVYIFFVQPFAMAWMAILPRIALQENANRIYSRITTYYILAGGTVAFAVGLLAPLIARLFGNGHFPISPTTILFLCLSIVASGLMYPINIGPYVREKTAHMVPVFLGSMILSIPLGWGFVRIGGVAGAAAALVVVYLIQAAVLGYMSNQLYPVETEWSRIVRVVVVLVASYSATRWLAGPAGQWWSPLILIGALVVGLSLVGVINIGEIVSRSSAE